MTHEGYNGWTNYETWVTKLWFDNDQGTQEFFEELAQEVYDQAEADDTFTQEEQATLALKERLESCFEEWQEDLNLPTSGVFCDLLSHAVGMIDWYEIAQQYIENVETPEKAEQKA